MPTSKHSPVHTSKRSPATGGWIYLCAGRGSEEGAAVGHLLIAAAGRFIPGAALRWRRQKPVALQFWLQPENLHEHDAHLGLTCVGANAGLGHPTLSFLIFCMSTCGYPCWRPGHDFLPQNPLHSHRCQPRCSAISPLRNLGSLTHVLPSPRYCMGGGCVHDPPESVRPSSAVGALDLSSFCPAQSAGAVCLGFLLAVSVSAPLEPTLALGIRFLPTASATRPPEPVSPFDLCLSFASPAFATSAFSSSSASSSSAAAAAFAAAGRFTVLLGATLEPMALVRGIGAISSVGGCQPFLDVHG